MIAFQLHAQPQRRVHNQRVTTSYTQKHLYANISYRLKLYHKHNKYLHVQLDTCADVNLMPESVYKLVFNNPQKSKLAKNDIDLTVYTRHLVDLIGKSTFYIYCVDFSFCFNYLIMTQGLFSQRTEPKLDLSHKLLPRSPTMAFSSVRCWSGHLKCN